MVSPIAIFRKLNKLIFYLNISTWFNPLNFKNERNKFLKSKTYQPQFIYPSLNLQIISKYRKIVAELQNLLIKIQLDEDTQFLLQEKIREVFLYLELLKARGKPELSKISATLYLCNFDDKTVGLAKKDVLANFSTNKKLIKTELLIKSIKDCSMTYQAKNWQVITSDEAGFNCRIFPEKKLIVVNEKINWDFFTLDGFMAHEIDGHVLRTLNSQKQENIFYKFQLPFYIKTEEGLASYLADYCSDNKFGKTYHGLKYLACVLALQGSFRSVYNFFLNHNFSSESAFLASFRIKRGFEDTSMLGCFAREAMYYEGMQEVKAYIDNYGDLTSLFSGKASLNDLKKLSSNENIIVPKRILEARAGIAPAYSVLQTDA